VRYLTLTEALIVVRIARNHPLPDGNKRLAWLGGHLDPRPAS
jgi:prophage maintenance system killer protein